MRRLLLISALALLGWPAAAHAADAASVKLVECVAALDPDARSATFEARMRPADGSERMQVRFSLQVDEGELPGWRRVEADGLDEWRTSFPGVRRYSYAKTVRNLAAPAAYRAVVRFRWLDAGGAVTRRARLISRTCRQPDLRPDLGAIAIVPVDGGYEVTVRNSGRSAAGPFSVALAIGAVALEPLVLEGLEPGEQRAVTFKGPACSPGDALTATVDGADAVDEREPDDSVLIATCGP